MGKSLKKLVIGLVLVGVIGLVLSKLTGGETTTTEDTEGIDRVTTRNNNDDDEPMPEDADVDEEDTDLEVQVEDDDDDEFDANLDLPAASGGLDTFDYLAVLAAGAKAAYQEYRNRV